MHAPLPDPETRVTPIDPLHIRAFRPGDEPALWRVHYSAIHDVASRDYTPAQIQAWAPADTDLHAWARRMQDIRPFVATWDGEPVGYADVQADGYIDHFFVAGAHARRGIGQRLMLRIHAQAAELGLTQLASDVSRTAEPLFRWHGFEVVERQFPVRRGVQLENARMRKALMPGV